jgi:hypothetical protein
MALELDIQAAIEKNLSAEVGATLKKRLEIAEGDARRIVELRKLNEELKGQVEALSATIIKAGDLDKKFQELVKTNAEVEKKLIRAEIIALKEEHAKERVAEMRGLVSLVFQNNQFKYNLTDNGYLPIPSGQGGGYFTAQHNRTITGQGEGAPPPAPGDVSR